MEIIKQNLSELGVDVEKLGSKEKVHHLIVDET
jgi:hypothetical protein